MNDRVKWVEHKGEKILYADYSNLKEEGVLFVYKAFRDESLKYASTTHKPLLAMNNTDNVEVTKKTKDGYRKLRTAMKDISMYSVVVGANINVELTIKILSIFHKSIHFARNIEGAKEWLVSQVQDKSPA